MVPSEGSSKKGTRGPGWSFTQWMTAIFGGIGVFLGLFTLFANEDEYVGLGGDLSWRVGEIASAWAYGLLIGGMALLSVGIFMAILGRNRVVIPATSRSDLLMHAGIFAAVNIFVWIQDFAIGGGLDYALWVTIPWAFGLLIHTGLHWFRSEDAASSIQESETKAVRSR